MGKNAPFILKNVFTNTSGNYLQLVDIWFDDEIKLIKPVVREKIEWNEISESERLNTFKKQVRERRYPDQQNVIDGCFNYAMPGGIDTHACIYSEFEDTKTLFRNGTLAAVNGGITTVIDMPGYSENHLNCAERVNQKMSVIEGNSYSDYNSFVALENESLDGIDLRKFVKEVSDAGLAGFRVNFYDIKNCISKISTNDLKLFANQIKSTGLPIAIHPEEGESIEFAKNRAKRLKLNNYREYMRVHGHQAEARCVSEIIDIASEIKAKFLLLNVTTQMACDMIKKVRWREVDIVSETTPHHLCFNSDIYDNPEMADMFRTPASIKWESDKEALWKSVKDGNISLVNSSHFENRNGTSDFWEDYSGYAGLETKLDILFTEGFKKNKLSLETINNLFALNPAKLFRLKNKGLFKKGKDADIVLVDLWNGREIKKDSLKSSNRETPFQNYKSEISVKKTWLRGELVADTDSTLNYKPIGKRLHT